MVNHQVHKMTDIILAAENGDAFKQTQIADLLAWERSNTLSFLIDPLEKVKKLLHRGNVCDIVRECHVKDTDGRSAEGPPFVVLNVSRPRVRECERHDIDDVDQA